MRIKLISFVIVLICFFSALCAGLFSVYRSEGRIISPEAQARLEAFLEEHDVKLPAFIAEQFAD